MKTIDIHTHGIGGYDTRTSDVDDILKIAELHGTSGVSEILLSIYPASIKKMRKYIKNVKIAMEKQCLAVSDQQSAEKFQQARIIGVHIEGPFLNPIYCGALNSSSLIEPSEHTLKNLIDGFVDIIKIITVSPELDGAISLIRTIADIGIIVSMGHSYATYAETEAGFNAGAKGITHIFNAMRGVHHREPGIAGFGLINKDIYIEIIADPYHLNQHTLDLIFRTKNQEKIIVVSDSVMETKKFSGERGLTDIKGKLLGGSMTITEAAHRLTTMGYNETIIMNCITKNPAEYLWQI